MSNLSTMSTLFFIFILTAPSSSSSPIILKYGKPWTSWTPWTRSELGLNLPNGALRGCKQAGGPGGGRSDFSHCRKWFIRSRQYRNDANPRTITNGNATKGTGNGSSDVEEAMFSVPARFKRNPKGDPTAARLLYLHGLRLLQRPSFHPL